MSIRYVAAAATLCLAGGIPTAARADLPVLSIDADHAASARFRLATDTAVAFDQARVISDADYAGFALYNDAGRLQGGILTAPAASTARRELDPVSIGHRTAYLPAGWYRVVVLANAPIKVRIPLSTGSGTTVTATTPDQQTYKAMTKAVPQSGPITVELRARLPRTTAANHVVLLGRLSPAVFDGKLTLLVCASQRNKPCGKQDTRGTMNLDVSGPHVARSVQTGLVTSGSAVGGTRDALSRVTFTPAAPVPFSFLFVHWSAPTGRT